MALIAQELLKNETYRSMMSNTYYLIPPTNKQPEERPLHGQHQMLNENPYIIMNLPKVAKRATP